MLIKGANLTQKQIDQVKGAFVYRWTIENEQRGRVWGMEKRIWPSATLQTDEQWINEHAFHFTKDGSRLKENKHAEPHYMAD